MKNHQNDENGNMWAASPDCTLGWLTMAIVPGCVGVWRQQWRRRSRWRRQRTAWRRINYESCENFENYENCERTAWRRNKFVKTAFKLPEWNKTSKSMPWYLDKGFFVVNSQCKIHKMETLITFVETRDTWRSSSWCRSPTWPSAGQRSHIWQKSNVFIWSFCDRSIMLISSL